MLKKLFEHANRGVLLDVIVFLVNVILMTILSRQLANLFLQARTEKLAKAAVAVFCLALIFLQPIGGLLKRRRAHRRRAELDHVPAGRLILPAYFLSQLVFLIGGSGQVIDFVFGQESGRDSADYFGLPPGLFTLLSSVFQRWRSPTLSSSGSISCRHGTSLFRSGSSRPYLKHWVTCSSS